MGVWMKWAFCVWVLVLSIGFSIWVAESEIVVDDDVKRSDFPDGFLFGAATSAYQIEGGFLEDGKSLSNWDFFCRINGSIKDGKNGDVADDHYHHYMEDIEIISSLGLTAYRLSISWSRILPRGKLGEVNEAGILFYNRIIDDLITRGIEPVVTIHHDDMPQDFEVRFMGWLSPLMQDEFVHLAETCFRYFGDRVRYWITMNEPALSAELAYKFGEFPPSRCSPPFGNCSSGNSDVEPLIAMHNKLLAHAKAAKLFRDRFKARTNGVIGITTHVYMYVPLTNSIHDIEAAKRALAFQAGWSFDPLVFGDYPPIMRRFHGAELPTFSAHEKSLLRSSIDFIGLNQYSTLYAKDCLRSSCPEDSARPIQGFVQVSSERDGVPIGDPTGMPLLSVVPSGMEGIVNYFKDRYANKPIIVTENGYSSPDTEEESYQHDTNRVRYHKSYLAYLARALRNGADVRGYFIWSLMDNFEWAAGYTVKFGLYRIDYRTLNRVPKLSAHWYKRFLSQTPSLLSSFHVNDSNSTCEI